MGKACVLLTYVLHVHCTYACTVTSAKSLSLLLNDTSETTAVTHAAVEKPPEDLGYYH